MKGLTNISHDSSQSDFVKILLQIPVCDKANQENLTDPDIKSNKKDQVSKQKEFYTEKACH